MLNFDYLDVLIETFSNKKDTFEIKSQTGDKTFIFKTLKNNESVDDWVPAVMEHIAASSKSTGAITKQSCKQDVISESDFTDLAQTGDILLFRSNTQAGAITRKLTKSHFDHVAMVVRLDQDRAQTVCYIEAVSGGVHRCSWAGLEGKVGPGKLYEKVCWRSVVFNRGSEMTEKLEVLLNEIEGHSYALGYLKLKTRMSTALTADEANSLIASDRTFFCSELVAKSFKCLGVIEDDLISCTTYHPVHFSKR